MEVRVPTMPCLALPVSSCIRVLTCNHIFRVECWYFDTYTEVQERTTSGGGRFGLAKNETRVRLTKWVKGQNFRHASNCASSEVGNERKRYLIIVKGSHWCSSLAGNKFSRLGWSVGISKLRLEGRKFWSFLMDGWSAADVYGGKLDQTRVSSELGRQCDIIARDIVTSGDIQSCDFAEWGAGLG